MPKDKIVDIDQLLPDAENVREHGDENKRAIKRSFERFGPFRSLAMDADGIIRAGNGSLEAAREAGITKVRIVKGSRDELVVVQRDDIHGEEAQAYAIADNRSSDLSQFYLPELAGQLTGLMDSGFDVSSIGFTEIESLQIARDFDPHRVNMPGDITEGDAKKKRSTKMETVDGLRKKWETEVGQLWRINDHRLLVGDSTDDETVQRLMGDVRADMVFTDPPYGVNIQGGKINKSIAGDVTQTAIPFSFSLAVELATAERAHLYFCGAEGNIGLYQKLFEKYCRSMPRHLVWVKNHFVMKPNGYHNQYELIFFGYKPGGGSTWYGGRKEDEASDVWRISRDASSSYYHPTQKPVELPARAIANSCPPGGVVYEPFSGSGSTFLAANDLGRKCYGIELDPDYAAVILERLSDAGCECALESG